MTPQADTIAEAAQFGYDYEVPEVVERDETPYRLFDERLAQLYRDNEQYQTVVITDYSDADGLGCAVLFEEIFDDVLIFPAAHGYGKDPIEAFKKVSDTMCDGSTLYITDLGPNEDAADDWITTAYVHTATKELRVRDHHDTPERVRDAINDMEGGEYIHNPDCCATQIVSEADAENLPSYLEEFVELTNIRDMFHTEDDRFEDAGVLASAAFWFTMDEYVSAARTHGINIHKDEAIGNELEVRAEVRETKLDWAMERMQHATIHGKSVAFIYGECYHSEAGRRALENHGCDIAVILKPSGKVSFRTNEETPIAKELATEYGGGGHPCAAGCNPIENDNEYDFDTHHETLGLPLKMEVAETISTYLSET